ncbi:MAG TPA: DUF998 domain-containing protein [Glaciihabitans sp.]|jgi:hypothetical membrane protein|nr:DUF998 domain-containing protein [Glaciihabitans sp.]
MERTTRRIARRRVRRRYAIAAQIGVLLYIAVDVVLQFLPPYYSPISEAESNLAVGPYGWIMNLNFLGRAVLSFCAIAAIRLSGSPSSVRTVGLVLLGLAGTLSGLLAFFPTDVADPSTSADGHGALAVTPTGTVHLVLATVGFVAALASFVLLTLWLRREAISDSADWRPVYRRAVVMLIVAAGGLAALAVSIVWVPQVLGLAERICLLGILGWVYLVCDGIRTRSGFDA